MLLRTYGLFLPDLFNANTDAKTMFNLVGVWGGFKICNSSYKLLMFFFTEYVIHVSITPEVKH